MENIFGEVVSQYSRKQAIEDGVLVDVTGMAGELGLIGSTVPIAVTSRLWHDYIVPADALARMGQTIEGRLFDLLLIYRWVSGKNICETIQFDVVFLMLVDHRAVSETVTVKAVSEPGNEGEVVVTLMLEGED